MIEEADTYVPRTKTDAQEFATEVKVGLHGRQGRQAYQEWQLTIDDVEGDVVVGYFVAAVGGACERDFDGEEGVV